MRKPHAALSLAVSLALLGAACGAEGEVETNEAPTTDPPATEAPAPTETAAPTETTAPPETTAPDEDPGDEVARISISGFSFGAAPTVSVGEEVEIVNNDDVAHTWTSEDDEFDSGSIGPSGSFRHTFDEPGAYPFFCSFHPEMRGSITVQG